MTTYQPVPTKYEPSAPYAVPVVEHAIPVSDRQTTVVHVVEAVRICRHEYLEDGDFTCCGIICAVCCFPLGIICLFCMRHKRCAQCKMPID